MEKVRVDQWMWSVRIFKSRSISNNACKSGRIRKDDKVIKPSFTVSQGDILQVRKDGFDLTFKVVEIIKKRVSAALATPCYQNLTSEDELNKYRDWYKGKGGPERRERGAGRPTKRERREIEGFKDDYLWDDED